VSLLLAWPNVRYALLALGVWGLLWMLGLLASVRVNPHLVARAGLELRSGTHLDLHIPWPRIADIRQRRSSSNQKLPVGHTGTNAVLSLQKTTNLEAALLEPISVQFPDGHRDKVDTIRFWTDTPTKFLDAVKPRPTEQPSQ